MAESYHKRINVKFDNKHSLKRFIELIQELEQDFYLKKKNIENHAFVSNPLEQNDELLTEEYTSERKENKLKRKIIVPEAKKVNKKAKTSAEPKKRKSKELNSLSDCNNSKLISTSIDMSTTSISGVVN